MKGGVVLRCFGAQRQHEKSLESDSLTSRVTLLFSLSNRKQLNKVKVTVIIKLGASMRCEP